MLYALQIALSAALIVFCSWLAGKRPQLAGFVASLPLTTLMVLPFSHLEYADESASTRFAVSIFTGLMTSLGFFVPFLLSSRTHFGFWANYAVGVVLLVASFFVHRAIVGGVS